MNTLRVVPHFDNETEEAAWWFENKALLEQDFVAAFADGSVGRGHAFRYVASPSSRELPVTLDPADEEIARELAASCGETYEMFVRRVMHQALLLEKTA